MSVAPHRELAKYVGFSTSGQLLELDMKVLLKKAVALLPPSWQQAIKRAYFGWQIDRGRFVDDTPDYAALAPLISHGDWVLDIGANIGEYTLKFSEFVGERGRVIAFEPVPETFEILAANVARFPTKNVTLINAAVSDSSRIVSMVVPKFATGLDNYYRAHIHNAPGPLEVLCLTLDSLCLPQTVRAVKIDAEGHDLSVIRGMHDLIVRDRPALLIEDDSPTTRDFLAALGYRGARVEGSVNTLFEPIKPD